MYINVFLNDKFADVTDIMYKKRDQISQETGRNCPPYLSNNKFSPQEDLVLKSGETYSISFWFNEKDGKRSASISIKESEGDYQGSGGGGYRKSSSNQGKSIGEDTSIFGKPPRNDDDFNDVPF
jgi:hypothetical protein